MVFVADIRESSVSKGADFHSSILMGRSVRHKQESLILWDLLHPGPKQSRNLLRRIHIQLPSQLSKPLPASRGGGGGAGKALTLSSIRKGGQFSELTSEDSDKSIFYETDFLTGPPGQDIIIDELAWQGVSKYESPR